ncbi:MAG: HAMP domain-containing protein [Deltaproteobacteria bacterium]|nr:MAG: HAMP domain-containing protein [Deltaproteobacteria bacterium]
MPGPSDPSLPWGPAPEVRRRRREGWIIAGIIVAVVLLAIAQFWLPQSLGSGSLGTDAVLIFLIDVNLILLVLLVFLVGRNIAKLIFERRRRILGSHLRTRLVGAFVAIALLPAGLLFLVGLVFVGNSIERWFNGQVERSLEGALEVAHAYYQDLAGTALGFARELAAQVGEQGLVARDRREALKRFLDARRAEYQLDLVEVFAHRQALARSRREDLPAGIGAEPLADLIRRAAGGEEATLIDRVGEADLIRATVPIRDEAKTVGVVVVDAYVPFSVVVRRDESERAFNEYLRLKVQRRPIQTNYTITLAVVTIVVLFSATWFGFYMARGITVPIQRLAEGTRAVAHGDLDHRIEGEGEDEIGTLVTAFNRMTAELKTSRTELESRRRYLETLLANITAGVVSADAEGRITTMNRAAEALLGMSAAASVGRCIDDAFAGDGYADVRELAAELHAGVPAPRGLPPPLAPNEAGGGPVERQLKLTRDGREVAVLLTGTRLMTEHGGPRGLVLFFEDVSHLLRVQRMEAWREVARRIAHEIKNPLTPIQLSAQRLRRRYAARLGPEGAVFDECTRTIIQQVDELKALVNEFSTFARLPAAAHAPQDLNRLVEEALVLFREGHREITFTFDPAPELPELELDREGIKRALLNLLDNAVAACAEARRREPAAGEPARVELVTRHDEGLDVVRLEIADDGAGMTPEVKARLFEPYFSTKPDGTGLGLAIVSVIVADHNGFIRVRDNLPRGSRLVMEFPVRRRAAQLAARAQHGAYAGA